MTTATPVKQRFEKEYQGYHGMSADRRKRQMKELDRLCKFAGKDRPEECDENDLRRYLADLVDQELHVNTVRTRGNLIRPFFGFAYSIGAVSGDRLMAIKAVENPNGSSGQSTPKPYSPKELKRFWAELDESWPYVEEKWWKRWRRGTSGYKRVASHVMRVQLDAIIALALDCGLRQSEIFHLDIDDMHHDNEFIMVRQRTERENGKNRDREVPHTEESRTRVRLWLELRHELKTGHDRPWISAVATQPAPGWLKPMSDERMKELLTTIGDHDPKNGDDHWKLHRFRHTCATNWLRAGMDLEVLSEMIGHSSLQQTMAYAELVRDDIARQVGRHEGRFNQMTHRRAAA